MEDLKGKRILLLYAKFFNYDVIVANKLRELGAIVDLYDARAELNTVEKAILKVYKRFFYNKLRSFHKMIQDKNNGKQYDFIFSNSYLPRDTVIAYRKKFPNAKLILYLDDSVKNMYGIERTFDCYDVVKTFDRSDAIQYNIKLQPLFYEDSYCEDTMIDIQYDLCFIGTIHSDRLRVISLIEDICRQQNLRFYHYCYLQSSFIYYFYWLTKKEFRKKTKDYFEFGQMKYSEVVKIISYSRAVLDIQHPLQTGLTMRTMETIGSHKKIITTNKDIRNYDICNENVYVIDRNAPIIESEFLKREYQEINKDILSKYSLSSWISLIFN